ncbi:uncharacterized protein [Pocillopora verrucosa]|uniref:uncharacterized protein n=1 Tax=Pocillopora verrucosa TaxID=203993 RepID=UPI003340E8E9
MENAKEDRATASNFTATSSRSAPEETVHINYSEVPLAYRGLNDSVTDQVSNSPRDVQSPLTTGTPAEGECQGREEHSCLNGNHHQVHSSPQPSTNEDLCSMQEEDLVEDSDSSDEGEGISVNELKQTDGYRLFVEALDAHIKANSTKE